MVEPIVAGPAWFDPEWYVHRDPDLREYPGGAFLHFVSHGAKEGRQPSPRLDISLVYDRHPGLLEASVEDILAVLDRIATETPELYRSEDEASFKYLLQAHGIFDEAWYLAQNRDVLLSGKSPIEHFIRKGAFEGREPGPAFDAAFYRTEHPEFVEESETAIEHFIRLGLPRGYVGIGRSAYTSWIEAFDTLSPTDLIRIEADAGSADVPVMAVHIVDGEAAASLDAILAGWRSQLGFRLSTILVRAADLDEGAWANCMARVGSWPGLSAMDPGSAAIALPAEGLAILAGGAHVPRPHAAPMLVAALAQPKRDAAYADHDHIDPQGQRSDPMFKPAMAPAFMRNRSYAGAIIAVRVHADNKGRIADLVTRAAARGGVEDLWAEHLIASPAGAVAHVPFILFHAMRQGPDTGAQRFRSESGRTTGMPFADEQHLPSVTIVIPMRDRVGLLQDCLQSVRADTDYPEDLRTIVVVDNDSRDAAALDYLADLSQEAGVSVVRCPGAFNFPLLCNSGASQASGDVLVFLNNDTTVLKADWLRQLVRHARQPHVGTVGAHLLYPDGTTQHGGVVLGVQGVGAHRLKPGLLGPAGAMDVDREMTAVTGACLAIRREVFAALGGFDPVLGVAFNDAKLCVSAHVAGYTNIYIGEPILIHHESKSRGFDTTVAKKRRNAREATYVRALFGALFRADPSYSPNLSLQEVDKLAVPPRVMRPWRRTRSGEPRRVLLLCYRHSQGHGVARVLEQQAIFLRARGWQVAVGGPKRPNELAYEGCERVSLWTPEAAAAYAISEGIDCIIAHSPPFFAITRYLGAEPPVYFTDHGEPPTLLFADSEERDEVDWEKRFCATLARRVFVISETVRAGQYRPDAMLIRNCNSHLSSWSETWAQRRDDLRETFGFARSFVVLNVCRFGPGERIYKGVTRYGDVASDLPFRYPELQGKIRFILVGKGDAEDVAAVEAMGIECRADVSDAELIELYAASDLYMNFSEWEGYNLGIGQALAMGLGIIASNISAHREFGVEVSDSVPAICAAVADRYARWTQGVPSRQPQVSPWAASLSLMAEAIEQDLGTIEARPS